MKLIAHRGACLERQEDTLASLRLASELGADAVECDPRYTKDGRLVLFHDHDLLRLAGRPEKICDLTLAEARELLAEKGLVLNTLDELLREYPASGAPVLLDFSIHATDRELYRRLTAAPFPIICGIHQPDEGVAAREFFPAERVLAFMPNPAMADEFAETCGNLRLWEQWLKETTPGEIKRRHPDREVWIMACSLEKPSTLESMNGSPESIRRVEALGADGMLLNDIRMALETRK